MIRRHDPCYHIDIKVTTITLQMGGVTIVDENSLDGTVGV